MRHAGGVAKPDQDRLMTHHNMDLGGRWPLANLISLINAKLISEILLSLCSFTGQIQFLVNVIID